MLIRFMAFLFILPAIGYAHEESCLFEARLSEVIAPKERSPQAEIMTVTAQVTISKAQSSEGRLSYLDCKHWESQSLKGIELQIPKSMKSEKIAGKIVKVEYQSRNSSLGPKSLWRLVDIKTN